MGARLTHWALPLAACALPWRAGFRFLRLAALCGVRVAEEDDAWREWVAWRATFPEAIAGAPLDEAHWRARWRLVNLVDYADLFLVSTRSDRWLARHAVVTGEWPREGPLLAITAHWGAGLWTLRHLRRAGRRARFLSARFDEHSFAGDRARIRYAHARVRALESAAGAPAIYAGGASAEIAQAWRAGLAVIALCDVAPKSGASGIATDVGTARLVVPRGLIRLAVDAAVPVVFFRSGIDPGNGRRRIHIGAAQVWRSENELASRLGAEIAQLIDLDAPAWHMWPYATQLMSRPAEVPATLAT